MRIVVTGSTSKIGINLIKKLIELGHDVIATGGSQSNVWKLGQKLPLRLQGDILIHLAHDRTLSLNENIKFTQLLCDNFQGKKIFLSSLSAHQFTESKYGKSKFEMEKIFLSSNSVILKAGIVYGLNVGGIFHKIDEFVKKLNFFPLPYRGNSILFTSYLDDLISEIICNIEFDKSKVIFAANYYPISLIEIISQLAKKRGKKFYFLPLPKFPFHQIVKFFSRMFSGISILDSFISLSKTIPLSELSKLDKPATQFRNFTLL